MNCVVLFFAGAALAGILSIFVWQRLRKRQRARLLVLCAYLEAASCGRETALARTEDEFSLLEDELYKTVSELRIAREQAQQERVQQADNLADIAHQLKTPLTSMSLMTQLLDAEAVPGQREYLDRLDSQLERLNWLTGSLLTMSRLDAGAVLFAPAMLRFEALLARAVEPIEQLLRERGQGLRVQGQETAVECDLHWTAEVLVNLLKNCSEHTPHGGVLVMEALSTPLYAQITVQDNGPGFDSAELPHLFARFFRGKSSGKDSIGIGLALCRAIVEGQGGMLRAENRAEGGARFVIRFYP